MVNKNILMFVLVLILVGSFSGSVLAQPSISSVSGTIVDGGGVDVSGLDFGVNSLDIEWTGGADGNIEQGLEGDVFSKLNWRVDTDGTSFYSPRYSDTRAHSGLKSILSQYPATSNYGSGFSYDYGLEFGEIYATWWVNFDHVDSGGQWKQWRLSPTSDWNDADGELFRGDFYSTDGDCSQALIFIFCNLGNLAGDYGPCFPDGDIGLRWTSCQPRDAWYRIELYAKESSSIGTRDGTLIYRIHDQSSTVSTPQNWIGTIITRDTGVSDRWRYMQFQNYWGNIVGDGTQEKIYIDDIYIQTGTRARIEIGDNSNWDLCTHREIQIPTLWSDGSITMTVNQGSFANGESAYLFVVDEDGIASVGYPITLSGTITSECSDTIDNDGDGQIDFPNDAGCTDANDTDETNCGDTVCEGGETCSSCVADCPTGVGEVCCSGVLYTGDCCSDADCISPDICNNNLCSEPAVIPGICEGLNLLMHFDNDLIDFSGNGNDGSFFGGANYDSDGKFGSSVSYDGADDAVIIPDSTSLSPVNDELTISVWIKRNGAQQIADRLVHKNGAWHLTMRGLSSVGMGMYQGGWSAVSSLGSCTDGIWCHVVGTYDGTDMSIYLNGQFDNSLAKTGNMIDSADDLYIGLDEDGLNYDFNGLIDEVSIWNRSLSATEILDLYNSGGPISCGATTCGDADTDSDGVVSILEVMAYITEWKAGNVNIVDLIAGITEWKNGC